ncbi:MULTISPECIES: helix-turn-helix domain-containing protein [Tatumella]|nr:MULTISPECIES: helix-turn-helix domain-containing protein [Tatumella]
MMNSAFFNDLISWIDNHIENRLNLDLVAERAGYSKWHLQRMFKEHTGYALGEYIRKKKLEKSACRLTSTNDPILTVAISMGFDSQQSFNRSFKREFGMAPGTWRRSSAPGSTQYLH